LDAPTVHLLPVDPEGKRPQMSQLTSKPRARTGEDRKPGFIPFDIDEVCVCID
jgi:hypothetical protein